MTLWYVLVLFPSNFNYNSQRKDEHMYLSIPNESVAAEAEEQLINDGNDIGIV